MKKVCKETSCLKDCIDEFLYYDGEDMDCEVRKVWIEKEKLIMKSY